jgi:hypothetical protein
MRARVPAALARYVMLRPSRVPLTSAARARMATWVENVLCGQPTASAKAPAESSSGSLRTSIRNIDNRVGCPSGQMKSGGSMPISAIRPEAGRSRAG